MSVLYSSPLVNGAGAEISLAGVSNRNIERAVELSIFDEMFSKINIVFTVSFLSPEPLPLLLQMAEDE